MGRLQVHILEPEYAEHACRYILKCTHDPGWLQDLGEDRSMKIPYGIPVCLSDDIKYTLKSSSPRGSIWRWGLWEKI